MFITLPVKHIKTCMGMDIVDFSKSNPKESFPIQDDYVNGVTVEDLNKFGQSKAYDDRRIFENLIQEQSEKYRLPLFHK